MAETPDPRSSEQKALTPSLVGADAFYFAGDDNLQIASLNAAAGVELTIRCRFMRSDGVIIPLVFAHTPNTDRTVKTDNYVAGHGWLLNVDIFASSGAPQVGQCFVMFRVIRGLLGNVRELATLLQGFVTSTQRIAWPGATMQWTTQRPGAIRLVTGSVPAAGAEISETVPTGARWRLLGFAASLTTDATAGSRLPTLRFTSGAVVIFASYNELASVGNSDTERIYYAPQVKTGNSTNSANTGPLSSINVLLAGWKVETFTNGLVAGDQWAAPTLTVEEFLEGA